MTVTTSQIQPVTPPGESAQRICTGRVVLREGVAFSVALEDEPPGAAGPAALCGVGRAEVVAQRAASCLLVPQPRDRVLLALTPQPFILAVLVRAGGEAAELSVDGDARVFANGGRLDLGASEGIGLTARGPISVLGSVLSLRAVRTELFTEHVEAVGERAEVSFGEVGLVARAIDVLADRVVQRAARAYRFIEQLDQLRARHFDYRAEESAQIKGKHTVMSARQVAKIDGEQIHVG